VKTISPDHQRPDTRSAARFIDANAAPTTPVVDVQYPFAGPPADAVRIYLERPHRVYGFRQTSSAWKAANRARSPIVISFPDQGDLGGYLGPPAPYDSRYRLVAEHASPGLRPITVREYAPR
jgi:hypothetical protein